MPDDGDPRLAAPIWVGRYELVPATGVDVTNATVMLSKQNMVQFLGDASGVTSGKTFATLPEECCPDETIMVPVVVEGASGIETSVSVNATAGELNLTIPSLSGTATLKLAPDVPPMVSVGYDDEGVPSSAMSIDLVNSSADALVSSVSTNEATVTAQSPAIQASGTVTIPQTIGILSVSPVGELSCNLSGKVHLNGINFHICSNYY